MEPGESAREAARREVREEVGLKIPEYELRLMERVPQDKGDHIIFEYRAKKAFKPRLSIEHDHFIWSPQKPTLSNGIFSYFKGKDTSGMTTDEKARKAAIGVGTTLAVKGATKVIKKKLAAKTAAKVGTKVAAKGVSKFIPFVGQAIMVVDAAPEAIAVARERREHNKRTWREVKAAKGVTGKVKALGKGTARTTAHKLGGVARIGAAAFVGSDVVKMGREAAMEKYQAMDNGLGSRLGGRLGGRLVGKAVQQGAKKAAQEGGKQAPKRVFKSGVGKAVAAPESLEAARRFAALAPEYTKVAGSFLGEAGKIVGLTTAAVGTAAFAVKGAIGAVKGRQQPPPPPAATNPSDIRANVAEINKLLKTMPSAWQTQLASSRMKLQAAGAEADQIPPARPNAHNVLLALNLNNRGAVSSEAAAGQEQPEGNDVPADVREAAMEGIRLSHKHNYGGYDFIGVARAIQLAISPKISDAALNRMRMYFDRKTKQDRLSDQYDQKHGKRYWSWLNWGGDPGARWSHSKRFAQLVKENPMLPVRQNFLFGGGKDTISPEQRNAMIDHAAKAPIKGRWVIVRAPAKPGIFSSKVGPAYYLVRGISQRSLDDTSEFGMPASYEAPAAAAFLKHAFQAFSTSILGNTPITLVDVYTGQTRDFGNINDYNSAAATVNYDWSSLMGKMNRGRIRMNPFYVTTGGQSIPQGKDEDPRTWAASAAHAQRQEGEGRIYKITGPDEMGRWLVLDKRTGKPMLHPVSGNQIYGMSKEGAQEVLKKLTRRTNPGETHMLENPAVSGELPTLKQFQQAVARVTPFTKVDIGDEPSSLAFRDLSGQYLGAVSFSPGHVRFINRGGAAILNMRGLATAVARVANAVFRNRYSLSVAVDEYAKNVLSVDSYGGGASLMKGRKGRAVANPSLAAYIAEGQGLRVRDLIPPTVKPAGTKKGKKAKKNPAQDLLEQALNQDSAAAYLPKDKELVRKMEAAGYVRILDESQARIRFAATSRARASRVPWQKFEPRKKSSEHPGQRNTPDERWTKEHEAEEQAYHSIHRAKRLPRSAKSNPSPGFTTESWLADVAGEEWANYDLNRAGVMHYSGSGIPTYRSLFRK